MNSNHSNNNRKGIQEMKERNSCTIESQLTQTPSQEQEQKVVYSAHSMRKPGKSTMHITAQFAQAFGKSPTLTSMAEFRKENPKPPLFDLVHKWNLTEEQKLLLDFHSLKKIAAVQLAEVLNNNKGSYSAVTLCNTYVPIYMYTSRRQIERDAQVFTTKHYPYYLSFRSVGNIHIVLVQRARYAE